MAYQLFNNETGEVLQIKQKKIKRTEPFLMMELKSAEELAKAKDLHGTELKVLLFVLSRMNFEGQAFPSQAAIVDALSMTKSQVSVALKRLVECRALAKIRKDGINGYEVHLSLASRGALKR